MDATHLSTKESELCWPA